MGFLTGSGESGRSGKATGAQHGRSGKLTGAHDRGLVSPTGAERALCRRNQSCTARHWGPETLPQCRFAPRTTGATRPAAPTRARRTSRPHHRARCRCPRPPDRGDARRCQTVYHIRGIFSTSDRAQSSCAPAWRPAGSPSVTNSSAVLRLSSFLRGSAMPFWAESESKAPMMDLHVHPQHRSDRAHGMPPVRAPSLARTEPGQPHREL